MVLGILVNTGQHGDAVIGIAKAAREEGHEVVIFAMDEGTTLFGDPAFGGLCTLEGIKMSFCEYSTQQLTVETGGVPEDVVCGSQFDNASMMHKADRVIVL